VKGLADHCSKQLSARDAVLSSEAVDALGGSGVDVGA